MGSDTVGAKQSVRYTIIYGYTDGSVVSAVEGWNVLKSMEIL